MAYLKHALGKTFYLKKGSAKLPTLLCLHGGPGSTHKRQKELFALSARYRVVVYDQLGCGKSSETTKEKWNLETFVKEVEFLRKHLNVDSLYLYGSSWGTTLALEYYLTYPKRVRGIIFQSPLFSTADWMKDAKVLIEKMPPSSRAVLRANVAGKKVDPIELEKHFMAYYARHVLRNKAALAQMMKPKKPNPGRAIYKHMWGDSEFYATGTLKNYDRRAKLKTVNVPVILICGEYDEARPETSKKYVRQFPNAKLHVVRNASHVVLVENPKDIVKTVGAFLNKLTS